MKENCKLKKFNDDNDKRVIGKNKTRNAILK